jgi:hypothetical protein
VSVSDRYRDDEPCATGCRLRPMKSIQEIALLR